MRLGNAPLIGLDIGAGMVKAVTLRRKGNKLVVERAGLMAVPSGAISGRQFLDPPAVANCVKRLCKDLGLRGRRAAVAVAGEEVTHARLKVERATIEALQVERASARALETLVRQELGRVAPFPLEEALVDFQVLDNFSHSQWVDAVAVAVKRGAVERLEQVLERAGKRVTVADSAACALANVFEINYQPASNEITALLHLGAATMTVCILRGATPLVVRDITLETSQPWREQAGSAERVVVELERVLEQMDEIADDHPLEPRSKQVSRLMLSGGGIRLRGLEEVLRERLRMPLEELNPFRNIEFAGSDALGRLVWDHVHCMPVAAGLAMRGVDLPVAGPGVEA